MDTVLVVIKILIVEIISNNVSNSTVSMTKEPYLNEKYTNYVACNTL